LIVSPLIQGCPFAPNAKSRALFQDAAFLKRFFEYPTDRLALEVDGQAGLHGGVLIVGAGGVGGDTGGSGVQLNEALGDEVMLEFIAGDVGKHSAVDLDAGREGLAALLLHLPAEGGILNDVLFGVGETIFAQYGANALAPATLGFEVSGDLRLFHK